MNLTEIFLRATSHGAEWVLWVLVALSLISVAVMLDRFLFFAARRANTDEAALKLESLLRTGKIDQARALVSNSKAVEYQVVAAGLNEYENGTLAVSEAMLGAKVKQRLRMDSKMVILGTLGNNAPFIGLFGTVLGIIKASQDMATQGAEKATNAVMAGVFEALVATAVGLLVAIPAVMAFNFFQRKIRTILARTDILAHIVLGHLKTDKPRKPPVSATLGSSSGAPPVVSHPVAHKVS